jgi:transcriptional regulator with XRE-family HTH domain
MQIEDPNLNDRIEWLRATINSSNLSQEALSEATGIHQSQISRVLSGQIRRLSKNVILLCKYVENLHKTEKSDKKVPPILINALLHTWDGSGEHAEAIAKVILSLHGMSVKHVHN